jgi:hypothetical protein
MRDRWRYDEAQARRYLDTALSLMPFDAAMPLETYLWPSKCKAGWGAAEVLRVLLKYGLGTPEQIEDCYQIARKTAAITFFGNQLPNGGWSAMHYPFSEQDPEYELSYVPLRGRLLVPQQPVPGVTKLWLPPEEITGEFLGELATIYHACQAYLQHL